MFTVPPHWFCAFGWLYYPFWVLSLSEGEENRSMSARVKWWLLMLSPLNICLVLAERMQFPHSLVTIKGLPKSVPEPGLWGREEGVRVGFWWGNGAKGGWVSLAMVRGKIGLQQSGRVEPSIKKQQNKTVIIACHSIKFHRHLVSVKKKFKVHYITHYVSVLFNASY